MLHVNIDFKKISDFHILYLTKNGYLEKLFKKTKFNI